MSTSSFPGSQTSIKVNEISHNESTAGCSLPSCLWPVLPPLSTQVRARALCCVSWCRWRAGLCWPGQPGALSRPGSRNGRPAAPRDASERSWGCRRGAGGPEGPGRCPCHRDPGAWTFCAVPGPRGARLALPCPLWFGDLHRDASCPCWIQTKWNTLYKCTKNKKPHSS